MKDKELFLTTDFYTADLKQVKQKLEVNGWLIKTVETKGKCRVNMYESEEDYDFWKDIKCSVRSDNFEAAFLSCLIQIQIDYKIFQNG